MIQWTVMVSLLSPVMSVEMKQGRSMDLMKVEGPIARSLPSHLGFPETTTPFKSPRLFILSGKG